jgi:hypothetical protein
MLHRLKPVLPIHTGTYDQQTLRRAPGNEMDTFLESPLERILQNSIALRTESLDTKVSLETSSLGDSKGTNLVKDWNSVKKKTFKLIDEEEP